MADETGITIKLDKESFSTLLRSNLSCFLSKTLTSELLEEITKQIIDSVDYYLNQEIKKE